MINIEYSEQYSTPKNNIVFFISKTKDLDNNSLFKTINFDIKNTLFIKNLKIEKNIEVIHYNKNKRYYIKFILLNSQEIDGFSLGASLTDFFKNKRSAISLNFSKILIQKRHILISDILMGLQLKLYKFEKYLKVKSQNYNNLIINSNNQKLRKKIIYDQNLIQAIETTKNLVSEPANYLNPVTYAEICKNLNIKGLKVKIFDYKDINKIGMNALLAVSKGSEIEPRVVVFEWNLKKNVKPTILVGKGVTFDTGGISLKPSSGMEEMITDMGGSAVVVGCMINAALNKINKSIVGIIGLVENMPDGKAQRPGDIINSLSGQTIEVLNTDAEGRLVLADIITYIQKKYKPLEIIDFATLTGAIMIALGTHKAGIFSNNDKLSNKLESAGKLVKENIWRLPLGDEYNAEINSSRADMKNIGSSRYGGSIHAAEFIKRFIDKNTPWAHLDIAGVSWTMKAGQNNITKLHNPGATAFGVRLIDKFLRSK
tara:strand:+ start:369 stop:1823 length:1455 start_codon:yes stop_codon:yes gene_type:complete